MAGLAGQVGTSESDQPEVTPEMVEAAYEVLRESGLLPNAFGYEGSGDRITVREMLDAALSRRIALQAGHRRHLGADAI